MPYTSFAQTYTHPIAKKITYVRGAFQGDCHSLYVFDGAEATLDSMHYTFNFRVSGGYKGKYSGSYECIIPFAKIDSTVILRLQDDDCLKEYLPKPALYRVELRFKEEDISLRSYGSPLPEIFDQIYLYFFSAFEAYDFEKTLNRLKNEN
jgi:hypothetical protein